MGAGQADAGRGLARAFPPGDDRHLVVDGRHFGDQAATAAPLARHPGVRRQGQAGHDDRRQELHQFGVPDLRAPQTGLGADGVPAVGHIVHRARPADQR